MGRSSSKLPENLRAARLKAKLTQEQLASALGLEGGRSYVCRVEAGKQVPRLEKLLIVARITGTPIEELVKGA